MGPGAHGQGLTSDPRSPVFAEWRSHNALRYAAQWLPRAETVLADEVPARGLIPRRPHSNASGLLRVHAVPPKDSRLTLRVLQTLACLRLPLSRLRLPAPGTPRNTG